MSEICTMQRTTTIAPQVSDVASLFQAWKRTHLGGYRDFISFIVTPSSERSLFLMDVQVTGERHGSLLFNLVTTG